MSFFSDQEKEARKSYETRYTSMSVNLNGDTVYAMFDHSGVETHDPQRAREVALGDDLHRLRPGDTLRASYFYKE